MRLRKYGIITIKKRVHNYLESKLKKLCNRPNTRGYAYGVENYGIFQVRKYNSGGEGI